MYFCPGYWVRPFNAQTAADIAPFVLPARNRFL
jgi:hypothetical protein